MYIDLFDCFDYWDGDKYDKFDAPLSWTAKNIGANRKVISKDGQQIIIYNVLGLSKDDIDIAIKREGEVDYLTINGERKDKEINSTYAINSKFKIALNKVDNIEYKFENGLLRIYINFKQPETPDVDIKYVE